MNRLTHLGALMTVLSLVACGGAEDAEPAPTATAMSSKQLKDLTADDVHSTCGALAARVKLSKEDACEFAGLVTAAAFGESCDTVKEQCMATTEPEPQRDDTTAPDCMPPAEHRAGCTATVAEYETCLLAQTEFVRTITCASPASTLETILPECEIIGQKCPRLVEGGDSQGQGDDQGQGGGDESP